MPSQVRCPGPLPWLGMDCRSLARDRASARPCAPHVAGAAVTAFIDLPIPARARVPAMSTCRFPLLVLLLAAASADLAAAILTVGAAGSGCDHTSIQAAINAAEASPGPDTIRITRSATWGQQALVVNTSQHLNIVGGFATCTQAATDNTHTVLDGAGGAFAPVLRITAGTGGIVKLRHLTVRGGDALASGANYGGGIHFRGNGLLELIESTISNNTAHYGGGIYAEGLGPDAELLISGNVLIQVNTALYSGGGIYLDGGKLTMNAPDSWIAFNEALGTGGDGGYGGGLQIVGGDRQSCANIGSPGVGGAGPIYGNQARYGGGVSVIGANGTARTAELGLYSTDASRQTAIRDNFASVAGGGIYVWARGEFGTATGGYFGRASLRNASLLDNAAPDGSAAFVQTSDNTVFRAAASLSINRSGFLCAPSVAPLGCPAGRPCSHVTGNQDQNANGQPTGGAVLVVGEDNGLFIERTELSGNRGGRVLRAVGSDTEVEVLNTLWSGNTLSQELIRVTDDTDLLLESSTFAGNLVGAASVLNANGRFRMQRSVLWQPGKTSLVHAGGTRFVENVLTHERNSLDGGNSPLVIEAPPRFVDPARGDYRLRAASPAVDFAATGGGPDLVGTQRGIDLAIVPNLMGSADLGAFERPALQPLVLFGDFDEAGDLALWPEATAGASTWTSAQNSVGGAGSGSIQVSQSNIAQPRVTARSQCIHLPGPGRYLLNGWGRSAGAIATRDSVLLHWQLRHDGGEACNAGPPVASGDHFLTTSTSWVRPTVPAQIVVSDADWTHTSSLTVALVVVDNGITFPPAVTGWFDGITLDAESNDLIFAHDFEP